MQIFRDIPINLFITLVVVAMSAWLESTLEEHPYYLLVLIAATMFVLLEISSWWKEKKLIRRLGIERERWNRIREEKVRLRKQYEDRLEISKLLTSLNEQALLYTKKQLTSNITHEQWEQIGKSVGRVMPKYSVFILLVLPRLQILAKNKLVMRFVAHFMLELTGVFNRYGLGTLEAEKDDGYSKFLKQVRSYEIGLPAKICEKIESSIIISKMFSTMQLFDLTQPAFKNIEDNIPPAYVNRFQFLSSTIQMASSKSIGNIHESIEGWLTGE